MLCCQRRDDKYMNFLIEQHRLYGLNELLLTSDGSKTLHDGTMPGKTVRDSTMPGNTVQDSTLSVKSLRYDTIPGNYITAGICRETRDHISVYNFYQ